MNRELRGDQSRALDALRRLIAEGKRRVMFQACCGAGKTIVAAAITEGARAKSKRVLFTVPTIELVGQTQQRFREEGFSEVGVIQADHAETDWTRPIQIASVQTLMRRPIPDYDVCMVDEAHIWFAFYDRLFQEAGSRPVVGFSATPWSKGLGAPGRYDHLLVAMTTADAIAAGILSDFIVFAPTHPDLSGVKTVAGDYHEGQLSQCMRQDSIIGDIVTNWKKYGDGQPTLGFAVDREHAQRMRDCFENAGIPADYMDCFTPPPERERIRQEFAAGKIKVVWNVGVLTTGVDWDVRCEIMARPTRSEILFCQIIGRALRTAPGKERAIILDHTDNHLQRFNFVTDIHHDTLDQGERKRKATQTAEPKLPALCPQCSCLRPPRVRSCPSCGYAPEPVGRAQHVDGELGRYDRVAAADIARDRRAAIENAQATRSQQQAWWAMLLWEAKARGYQRGWAAHVFQERWGIWPPRDFGAWTTEPDRQVRGYLKSRKIAWAKSARNPNNSGNARRASSYP